MKNTIYIFLSIILFYSCSSSDDGADEEQKEEVKEVTLEGDYVGTWNSTTDQDIVYTDYAVSAKFKFSGTNKAILTGVFFATSGFSSCCGADNDGTMTVNLDSDTITSFNFNDTIIGCTGNFTGTGSISSKNPFTIQIDFTGDDCDGEHDGQLLFKRINN